MYVYWIILVEKIQIQSSKIIRLNVKILYKFNLFYESFYDII
jgi:hypothetical protein